MNIKKILAMVLVVAMCFSMIPTYAFADGEEDGNHVHDMEYRPATAASCGEAGNTEYWECTDSECGAIFADEAGLNEIAQESTVIPALGHDFSVFVETVEATEDAQGYTTYQCSRCDATEQRDFTDYEAPVQKRGVMLQSNVGDGAPAVNEGQEEGGDEQQSEESQSPWTITEQVEDAWPVAQDGSIVVGSLCGMSSGNVVFSGSNGTAVSTDGYKYGAQSGNYLMLLKTGETGYFTVTPNSGTLTVKSNAITETEKIADVSYDTTSGVFTVTATKSGYLEVLASTGGNDPFGFDFDDLPSPGGPGGGMGWMLVVISDPAVVVPEENQPGNTATQLTATIQDGVFTENAAAEVEVSGQAGTVTFNAAAASALASAGALTLTVENTATDETTGAKTFEINLTNGDGNVFTSAVNGAKATVTVPFTHETGKVPVVYLVVGETRTPVAVTGYTDTTVTFEVEHFSVYDVQNESVVASFYQNSVLKYSDDLAEAISDADDNSTVTLLADIDLGNSALTIDKGLTITSETGHTYSITSSAAQAVLLTGSGDVTFDGVNITARAGHGIQAGNDSENYSGMLTFVNGMMTVAKRGIRVYSETTGFGIAVTNAIIQSNVADPTTAYTTGDDSMGLSLGACDKNNVNHGYTVTITNSEICGFSYCINSVTSGSNLSVSMTGGKTYGRAALNVWGSNNSFTLSGVEVHGLNNQTGPTEAFACIVENKGAHDNTFRIIGCTFLANLSNAAASANGSTASEQMIDLRGSGNSAVHITGNTTYSASIGNAPVAETAENYSEYFGLIYSADSVSSTSNKRVDLDSTAVEALASTLQALPEDVTEATESGITTLGYVSEVYYNWTTNGGGGVNCSFDEPFDKGWLDEGEFIDLNKDVSLDKNLTPGVSFTLNLKGHTLTPGVYTITIAAGKTVTSDTAELSFFAVPEGCHLVTAGEGPYTYTAEAYVAMIGTTGYPSLAAAIAAAQSGDTITLLADIQLDSTVRLDKVGTYVIDGDGHTISMASGASFGGDGAIGFGPAGTNATAPDTTKIFTLKNTTITGFDSEILRVENVKLTIDNCTFQNNIITKNPANRGVHLLRLSKSDVTIENSTFSGNTANEGIYYEGAENAPLTVTGSTFSGNTINGSGVFNIANTSNAATAVTGNTFSGNTLSSTGNIAVVYCSGPATVSGNLFSGNSVTTTGSDSKEGVVVLGSGASGTAVTNNAFDDNTLGTTATNRATVWVNDKNTGYTYDVSGNFWGDRGADNGSGAAAQSGTGKDIYSTGSGTQTNSGFATGYSTTANVPGATVTVADPVVTFQMVDSVGKIVIQGLDGNVHTNVFDTWYDGVNNRPNIRIAFTQTVEPGGTATKPTNTPYYDYNITQPNNGNPKTFTNADSHAYTFDGWATADGELYDFTTPVASDLVLHPRFSATGATIVIHNEAELRKFAREVELGRKFREQWGEGQQTVKLANDIVLTSNWTPVGGFEGIFDGDNHSISGLVISATGDYAGFFSGLNSHTVVKDLTFVSPSVTSTDEYVGVLAGSASSNASSTQPQVSNVNVTGAFSVSGENNVGALIGQVNDGVQIEDCTITGTGATVTATGSDGRCVGGLLANTIGAVSVTDCSVSGVTVTGYRKIGGLIGQVQGNLTCTDASVSNVTLHTNASTDYSKALTMGGFVGIFPDSYSGSTVSGTVSDLTMTGPESISSGNNYVMGLVSGGTGGTVAAAQTAMEGAGMTFDVTVSGTNTRTVSNDSTYAGINGAAPSPVAKIGETTYYTLQEAFNAAVAGDSVRLLRDVTLSEALTFNKAYASSPVYLYLDGHTLTGDIKLQQGNLNIQEDTAAVEDRGKIAGHVKVYGSSDSSATNYSKLTTAANVIIEAEDQAVVLYGATENTDGYGASLNLTGTITATNGTAIVMNGSGTATIGNGFTVSATVTGKTGIEVNGGTLNVSKGYFGGTTAVTGTDGAGIAVNSASSATKVTITGDTVDGSTEAVTKVSGSSGTIAISGGSFNTKPDDSYIVTGKAAYLRNGRYVIDEATPVAKIGETPYFTLKDALDAVDDNQTVQLLADYTGSHLYTNNKTFTIDLNGHTITGQAPSGSDHALEIRSAHVTVTDTAQTKGKIVGAVWVWAMGSDSSAAGDQNSLTLDASATINADTDGLAIWLKATGQNVGYGSQIDINGTVNGHIWVDGNIHNGNSVINVAGTINGSSEVGIALQGEATVNVNTGASISSTGTAISVRGGTLVVNGDTITGGTSATTVTLGENTPVSGAGIAVVQYDLSNISVTVSGGMVTGYTPLYFAKTVNTTNHGLTLSVDGGTFTTTGIGTEAVDVSADYPEARAVGYISGGTFSSEPDAAYIATGYVAVQNQDTTWTVVELEQVSVNDGTTTKKMSLAGFRDRWNAGEITGTPTVTLLGNIDLTGKTWSPIGTAERPFAGTFDGDENTITGLGKTVTGSYVAAEEEVFGLFGYVGGGAVTLQDLTLASVSISLASGKNVGGVIGYSPDTNSYPVTLTNVEVSGSVQAYQHVGGLIGKIYSTGLVTIENCTNNAAITSNNGGGAGGLVGFMSKYAQALTITGSTNNGAVTGSNGGASGLVGQIASSYSDANADKFAVVTITNSKNTGAVTATGQASGIAQIDQAKSLIIDKLENTGNVTSSGGNAGGLFAHMNKVVMSLAGTDSNMITLTNSGNVSGKTLAGGISAYIQSGAAKSFSYVSFENSGNVSVTIVGTRENPNEAFGAGAIFGHLQGANASFEHCTFTNSGTITAPAGSHTGLMAASLANQTYTISDISWTNSGTITVLAANKSEVGIRYTRDYSLYLDSVNAQLFGFVPTGTEVSGVTSDSGNAAIVAKDGTLLVFPMEHNSSNWINDTSTDSFVSDEHTYYKKAAKTVTSGDNTYLVTREKTDDVWNNSDVAGKTGWTWYYSAEEVVIVTFNANNGSATPETTTQFVAPGVATALTANSFTNTGKVFSGWNTVQNPTTQTPGTAYADGAQVTLTADTTLYAQWAAAVASITKGTPAVTTYYETLADAFAVLTDGGTLTLLQDAPMGAKVTLPASATVTILLNGKQITDGYGIVVPFGTTAKSDVITNRFEAPSSEYQISWTGTGALYTYTVSQPEPVATLTHGGTNTNYISASDAMLAARDGDTVTLIADVAESLHLKATDASGVSGGAVTLNMNSKTVTGSISSSGGSTLTITGEGTVDNGAYGKALNAYGGSGAIIVENGSFTGKYGAVSDPGYNDTTATMTINGGTFTGTTAAIAVLKAGGSRTNGGSVTVTGGTFIGPIVVEAGTLTITGGTFDHDPSEYVVEGYAAFPGSNNTYVVIPAAKITFYANGGSGTMEPQYVPKGEATALTANSFTAPADKGFTGWNTVATPTTQNPGTAYADEASVTLSADTTLYAQWASFVAAVYDGDTLIKNYVSLQEAVNAANGKKVVLLSNIDFGHVASWTTSVTVDGSTVTLDLAGYAITGEYDAGKIFLVTNGGQLTIDDSSEGKTGTITANRYERYAYAAQVNAESKLTVNNGTLAGYSNTLYINNAGTIEMNGGTVAVVNASTDGHAIGFNGADGALTINNGSVIGNNIGIYPADGYTNTITINGGSVTGGAAAIAVCRNTSITVNDGTIGSSACPYAFDAKSTDKSDSVTITGGTFEYTTGLFKQGKYSDTRQNMTGSITGGTFSTDPRTEAKGDVAIPSGYDAFADTTGDTFTVKACWTVTFNANDGSATPATKTQTIAKGETATLDANTFTNTGKAFTGWNTAATPTAQSTAYADGASVTLSADITLYAQWTDVVAMIGTTPYTSLAAAIAAVPTDGTATTITMIANSAEASTITIAATKNIVLELNGKTVSYTTDAKSVYFITNNGTLTVQDSTQTPGEILLTAQADTGYSVENVTVYNLGGTLNLNSGIIENATAGGLSYAVNNSSNAWGTPVESTFNMTGGILRGANTDNTLRVYQNSSTTQTSHNYVNISGGTIENGIFVDTFIYQPTTTYEGSNIETVINISGNAVIVGLVDMKLRHPFNTSLNITGGDFTSATLCVRKHDQWSSVVAEPTDPMVTISGGKFSFETSSSTNIFGLTGFSTYSKGYLLSGGVYNVDLNSYNSIEFADGYIGVVNPDPTTSANYPYTVGGPYAAKIGTTYYATLAEAVTAATAGQTITLLADVSLTERLFVNAGATPAYAGTNNRYATTSENRAVTLDLNGHNITSGSNIALAGGSLSITGTGTISTSASGLAPIEIRGTGSLSSKRTLTIGEGVTLNGQCYGLNVFGSNDAQKNVIDVTVNGTVNGMLFVLGNLTNTENQINVVVNGTVDASNATGEEAVHTGIAACGYANVTVNDGAVVKGESGIELRAGSLTVNGGTITATASNYNYTANGSGTTTKGAAIAVAQHGTKLATNATLNGGTLTGTKEIGVTDVNGDMNNVSVVATQSYTQSSVIPEGYEWVETSTAGQYTLVKKQQYFASLSLGENLNINLYIDGLPAPNTDYTKHYRVEVSDPEESDYWFEQKGSSESWGFDLNNSNYISSGAYAGMYKITSPEIYSYEMTRPVVIKVLVDERYFDGNATVFDNTYDVIWSTTTSVKDICVKYINNESSSANLCRATLEYGAAAQTYFNGLQFRNDLGQTVDHRVNKDIMANDYEGRTAPDPGPSQPGEAYASKVTSGKMSDIDVSRMSASVLLGSQTGLEIKLFGATGDQSFNSDGYSAVWSNTEAGLDHGTPITLTTEYVEGVPYVSAKITGIACPSLPNTFYIKFTKDNSSLVLRYSPYSYARAKWNSNGTIAPLVKALVLYGNAAADYFPQSGN